MGRLGFNFMQPKEQSKSVEDGEPDEQQNEQNEKNENVEICELLLTIEQRNRTIRTLRLMLISLTTVIIVACGFIALTQSRVLHNEQSAAHNINKLESYSQHFDALQGQYDAVLDAVREERSRNCTRDQNDALTKLEKQLTEERAEHSKEIEGACTRYDVLRTSFENLQRETEIISRHCGRKETDLKAQLKAAEDERAELVAKLEESNKKLRVAGQRQLAATTPAPSRSLFDPERLKKINDIVKDIENGAAIFNLGGFMKKTDEAFRS
ncbi:uncharacterized protein LOC100115668 isoform X1 [Nasonia vitripennis]|uniref:Uncharacterized protein n=1 Tax=Nasonia vitripennis TaxID=7425 RepID=A0A7M7G2P3_NASVI|nr:uncharacterized protein LOC100115668 isoform X1 [Nasonia vitripennis]